MPRYRKKPVVIEAWRLPMSDGASRAFDGNHDIIFKRAGGAIVEAIITTMEGVMTANNGDWIIKGVKGEIYPCKDEIFRMTYEAVSSEE